MPQSLPVTGLSRSISTAEWTSFPWKYRHKTNRVHAHNSCPKSASRHRLSRAEDSQGRHNKVRTTNEAYSWPFFFAPPLPNVQTHCRQVMSKICKLLGKVAPRSNFLSPSEHFALAAACSIWKEHEQEDSVAWVHWPVEQDWRMQLFLSLGLNFALSKGSIWHFCTGK